MGIVCDDSLEIYNLLTKTSKIRGFCKALLYADELSLSEPERKSVTSNINKAGEDEGKTILLSSACGEISPFSTVVMLPFLGKNNYVEKFDDWSCTAGGPGSNFCSILFSLCETGCHEGYYACCNLYRGCRCIPDGCEPGDECDDDSGNDGETDCEGVDCDDDDPCEPGDGDDDCEGDGEG